MAIPVRGLPLLSSKVTASDLESGTDGRVVSRPPSTGVSVESSAYASDETGSLVWDCCAGAGLKSCVGGNAGITGLMLGVVLRFVVRRISFGATGGRTGAANGGKSCADESPNGVGVASETI